MYLENDLVSVLKRENNNKRKYLVANKLQGKHIAAKPLETLKLFDELAKQLKEKYNDECLLLVGFAETATAIGSRLAVDLDSYYMQTTRENIEGVEYLYFTESHSHATEQKLIKTDLDTIIDKIDRIIFVEDEVTTGNTILKIVNIIEKTYDKHIAFSVASILNGMDYASKSVYDNRGISTHYLVKTSHETYSDIADAYKGNGKYYEPLEDKENGCHSYKIGDYVDARRLTKGSEYNNACDMLWQQVKEYIDYKQGDNILVVGTEEFMYPAIYVAGKIADMGCDVRTHSTTRSPITVSLEDEYALKTRYKLHSMYDDERIIYIYDLKKYDKVLIVTDAKDDLTLGTFNLKAALSSCGNTDITVIRWC